MPSRPPAWRLAVALVLAVALGAAGCGDDDDPVAAERSEQLRDAAIEAGLPQEVAEVLGLAAAATGATFRVAYPGDGGLLVVTQRPPDRRIDLVEGSEVLESRVVRGAVAYLCTPDEDGELTCVRDAGAVRAPGTFTDEALTDLVTALEEARQSYDLTVEERTVAGTTARCLVTTLRSGIDAPELGAIGTLCLSPEGVQLLVDTAGSRLEASDYATEVPADAFELPRPAASG